MCLLELQKISVTFKNRRCDSRDGTRSFFFQVVVFCRLRVYFPDDQTLPSLKAQLYRFVCFKCITMPIIVLGNRLLLYRYRPI